MKLVSNRGIIYTYRIIQHRFTKNQRIKVRISPKFLFTKIEKIEAE